jgi:glycosyltransferase involved in cell wall biosynthesis
MLIHAFSNTCPNEYTLHIYGEGPQEMILKDEVRNLKMSEKIFIEGKTSRVVEVLSDSEIFVLCSNYEGMPNALIEAMAMGLVCVSTNFPSGGAEELIENYKNGILIPVGDQKKLESVLRELFWNKKLCEKLSLNAIQVKKTLQKEMITEEWLGYLSKLHLK